MLMENVDRRPDFL